MDYLNFRGTTKQKLSEFNLGEIRGWMIDRLYQIEINIDLIICDYFKPENKDDFRRIILSSAIISIGAKTKILRNIKSFDKNIISKIQKLSSIRNAFAHLPISEDITVTLKHDDDGNVVDSKVTVLSKMEVMSSSGELKWQDSKQLVLDFFDLNKEIRNYIDEFNHS